MKDDITAYREELLNRYSKEVRDAFLLADQKGDYFLPVPQFLYRVLENPYAVSILAFILSRCKYNTDKGYGKDGYVYVTFSDIQNNLRISTGAISKIVNKLIDNGILLANRERSNTGNKIYYKANIDLFTILRTEDTLAWYDCIKNGIEPTRKKMDARCPSVVAVRKMFNKDEKTAEEVLNQVSSYVCANPALTSWFTSCMSEVHLVHVRGSSGVGPRFTSCMIYNREKGREKEEDKKGIEKAVLNRTAPKPDLADARSLLAASDFVSEVSKDKEGIINPCNKKDDDNPSNSCNKKDDDNHNSPCTKKDDNHNSPCLHRENDNPPAETLEEVENKMAASAAPVFRATPKLMGAEADAFLDSVEQGLNTPLQVDKEPCLKEAQEAYFGKADENKKSLASLFTGTKGPKKINTKRELDSIRQSDPAFMRIYDFWVDEGFPAHKPDTVVFKESRKYIKQVLDGTFFVDKMDLDQYARKYSVREIIKSIKNFKLAFNENYEPLNKKWLKSRRSLAKFLFDPTLNSKSLFVEYLEEPALLHPIEKTPEAKYKEKFGVDYVFLPDWLVPHYEKQEETWNFNEDALTEEQKDCGVTFYFMGIMRERDDLFEGCNWGKLPFGWSDWQMFRKMFDEKEKVEAWEYETNPNFYARLKDRFIALRDRVNEMESDMTRGHLFSERIWAMLD